MSGDGEIGDRMGTVARRIEFLELLDEEGPLATRDVVDALEHSRSTVTRALRSLREADLVEKRGNGYEATLAGTMAADEYRRYEATSRAVLSNADLLAAIPDAQAPPVEVLTGAETAVADEAGPVRPLEAVADRVHRAGTVRAYLPTLINTHLLRGWHRSVLDGDADAELAVDPDLLAALKGQYPGLLAEMAAAEGTAAFETTGPPYGIFLTTNGGNTTLSVVVYEDDAAVRGLLTNDAPGAVEWGRSELDRLVADAREVTDDLSGLGAALPDGSERPVAAPGNTTGKRLPVDLEAEGFVRLSAEYFETHGVAPPSVGWRTGFTLPEVRAGHAVDRLDDRGRNLPRRLVESLRDGRDLVVLGPPGSGKSTVCMAVACEWYDRGIGPVLYRERGGSEPFESTALLEAVLRQSTPDEPALVVVEDAVREDANAVFEVMRSLAADSSVVFLFDARTGEWRDPGPVGLDPRLDAYRRDAVERVTVPDVDERACERFVEGFTELVEGRVDLSGSELADLVDAGDGATGDALVAQYHLVRRFDPPAEDGAAAPTALEAAVRRTYRDLAEDGAALAPDLAALVALLTAAGVPVAREYLHAAAPEGEVAAVEAAVADLEGRLLFERRSSPGRATYRTPHETWALRFLEGVLEQDSHRAVADRVGGCVTRLLALADDPDRRRRIERRLGGRASHLHRVETGPGDWADEVVRRVFGVGLADASLAPLFGDPGDAIELPDACSGWTSLRAAYWRGRIHRTHGDIARAERAFRAVADRADGLDLADAPAGDPAPPGFATGEGDDAAAHRTRWRAASRRALGTVARDRGEYEAAEEHHRAALSLCREAGDRRGEATVLGALGTDAVHRDRYDRARDYCERSLEIARELGDEALEATNCNTLGIIATTRGNYDEGEEYLERSLAVKRERDDREGRARIHNNLGAIARKRGDYDRARTQFDRGLAIARELGTRRGEAIFRYNLGRLERRRGAYDRAREHHERSLAIAREVDASHREAIALAGLGRLEFRRGAYDRAREHHERSLSIARDLGDRQVEARNRRSLARVARLTGEYDCAGDHLDRAREIHERIGADEVAPAVRHERGALALARGDIDAAREHARRALAAFEDAGKVPWRARTRLLLGRIAAEAGDPGTAREHWQAALETFEAAGAYPEALDAVEQLVELCRDRGDADGAREWCRRAREWCRRARDLLAEAPEATTDRNREWVEHHAATLA